MRRNLVFLGLMFVVALSNTRNAFGQAKQSDAVASLPVGLTELVNLALERNPELRASRRGIDVMRSKIGPAAVLPDPELMVGQMNEGSIIPFTTLGEPDAGFSEIYVGLNQEIPFPGKLRLKGKVAEMEAKEEESRYRHTRLRVVAQVKEAFYELYAIDKSIEIVEKERKLLEQLEKIASVRYSVGKTAQQDILDAQVEISRLEERAALLHQRREGAEALINTLVYRPVETPIGPVSTVEKSRLEYGLSELNALAEQNFPLLQAQQRLIDRDAFALDLAKKGKYPDFGFTFVYHNRGSNRPYWTIGGTAKIPLFFGHKQRHEIEGAAASIAQSRHAFERVKAQAFYNVKNLYLMAVTADRLLKLYDEGIIRQASFSLEAAVGNYEVGKIDFLTLLTSWTRALNYELTYHEQLAEYQKALAQLEPLIGIELVRS
jgi:outer membrane protein, heavy metal efflux system